MKNVLEKDEAHRGEIIKRIFDVCIDMLTKHKKEDKYTESVESALVALLQMNLFINNDYIEKIEWSNDSNLILVGLFKRSIIEVKQMKKPDWICRIQEGIAGISHALFSPDSRNILTICNNNIKLTIWSLTNKNPLRISLTKGAQK